LDEIGRVMGDASICGLGHTAALAVRSAIGLGLIGNGGRP
jgi:NADH-quinone oxidoreductase subunit F